MAILEHPSKVLRDILSELIGNDELYGAVLSDSPAGSFVTKITVRPIDSRSGRAFQASEQRGVKAFQYLVQEEELPAFVEEKFAGQFKQLLIFGSKGDYHWRRSHKGKVSMKMGKPSRKMPPLRHNRAKRYLLPEGSPVSFLVKLKVMSKDGRVLAAKSDKFRQINRFLEIVDDIMSYGSKEKSLNIVDFGCGKAYLTFALYYYLSEVKGLGVNIIGLDLKEEVVAFCAQVAEELNFTGLQFKVGDIANFIPAGKVDMVVSLHACNTATDLVLEKAVRWEAETILAVPCCHHELYGQLENELLAPLLRHGILRERLAALVTDAARAQLLELLGYRCQVIEFIDLEHTAKNLLLRAVRRKEEPNREALSREYRAFADQLHIRPSLERYFQGDDKIA